MDPAHQVSAGLESGHALPETDAHTGETASGEARAVVEGESSAATTSSSTPHVSLFSPGVPASPRATILDFAAGGSYTRATSDSPLNTSRSMPSLAHIASMSKRTTRLKTSEELPPIVQLQTRIERAQKSADDPTTPLEADPRRRTTLDLMRSEHTVRTDIGRLFSESAAVTGSRAPSYNNATGPLYLRGTHYPFMYIMTCVLTPCSMQRSDSSPRPPLHPWTARRTTLRYHHHRLRTTVQPTSSHPRPRALFHHSPL